MKEVVGVRFKEGSKVYYFSTNDLEFNINEAVIVETVRGYEYGRIVIKNKKVEDKCIKRELKPVVRKANIEDKLKYQENLIKQKNAFDKCKKLIKDFNLEMELLSAEYTFDLTKLIFNFLSNERIDFRELVKELAKEFRTRIEMRQLGPRDEAKQVGALGPCGKECCCKKWMGDFSTVTIKMAKNQNLSLNPTKISGMCGKLMCCLKFEDKNYKEARLKLPKVNDRIDYDGRTWLVNDLDVLGEKLNLKYYDDSLETAEYIWVDYDKCR